MDINDIVLRRENAKYIESSREMLELPFYQIVNGMASGKWKISVL